MAHIHKEITLSAPAADVWSVLADFAAAPPRIAPGFVLASRPDEDARIVTFSNGMVAREQLIDQDDSARRVAYSVVGGRFTHHNASMQVFAEGEDQCRLVWIVDLLPNELAGAISAMVEEGSAVMKRTLSQTPRVGTPQ